jgi:hypothetical protein
MQASRPSTSNVTSSHDNITLDIKINEDGNESININDHDVSSVNNGVLSERLLSSADAVIDEFTEGDQTLRRHDSPLLPGAMSAAISKGRSFLSKLFQYSWAVVNTEDDATVQVNYDKQVFDCYEQEKEILVRELGETIEYALLPDLRVARFLCHWLDSPIFAMNNYSFTFQEWKDLLTLFGLILKSDFDRLQDWR